LSQITEQIHDSDIGHILENSLNGIRPESDDCIKLLNSDDVYLMGLVAGELTRKIWEKGLFCKQHNSELYKCLYY